MQSPPLNTESPAIESVSLSTTPPQVHANEVRVTSPTGGQKGAKAARYDLIPIEAMRQVAELYGFGAKKYSDHNWAKGYQWSLSYAAMQRHATQFWGGEDFDSESQLPHLASVVFHALTLMTFMTEHPDYDDRRVPHEPEQAQPEPEHPKVGEFRSGQVNVDRTVLYNGAGITRL